MPDTYFKILGVERNASLNDIKDAYRKKAKLLHPDVNPSPDAHEQFILLNEAFEYLQNYKTGKVYSNRRCAYTKPQQPFRQNEEWQHREKHKARERAQAHARMRYEAYVDSDYYKTTVAVNILADFISVVGILAVIIGAPLISYMIYGKQGLLMGGAISAITILSGLTMEIPVLQLKQLKPAFLRICRQPSFQLFLVGMLNIYLFLRIGLSTFIPTYTLLMVFALAVAFGYAIVYRSKSKYRRRWVVQALVPGVINFFLLLNFLLSGKTVTETYAFIHTTQRIKHGRIQKTSFIKLEGNKYNEYQAIRYFTNYNKMKSAHFISYEIATGPFGFRVMKDYRFK